MLTDINSDFGMNGQPFEVVNDLALMNIIKNLFRQVPKSDRYEYILKGLNLERLLKDPPSVGGADTLFLMVTELIRNELPNITHDTSRSSVTPNMDLGEYDIVLVLNGSNVSFSI